MRHNLAESPGGNSPSGPPAAEETFVAMDDGPHRVVPIRPDAGVLPVFRILIPIWGERYIELFSQVGLPALLADRNLPFLARETTCEVLILTTADSVAIYRANPTYRRLTEICATSFVFIDDIVDLENYGVTLTFAYSRGIRSLGERQQDSYFVFLNADFVLSNNAFATMLSYLRQGHSAVLAPSLRCNEEDVYQTLAKRVDRERQVLDLAPRELVEITLPHLHPTAAASIVNRGICHHLAANQFFWEVDEHTLIGRFFLLFMLCIRVETPLTAPSGFCDYTFVPDLCPSGNFAVVTDSDQLFIMEMQATRGEIGYLALGQIPIARYAKRLSVWTTREHRAYAAETLIFHARDLPLDIAAVRQEADRYMVRMLSALRPQPAPHKRHPFWLSAIGSVKRRLDMRPGGSTMPSDIEWPSNTRAAATIGSSRSLGKLQSLFDRVVGTPPFVGPLHPYWLDYRIAARLLSNALNAGFRQGLYVKEGPNPVDRLVASFAFITKTIMLDDVVDHAESISGQEKTFDYCFIYLTNRSIHYLWPILGTIARCLEPTASVAVFVDGLYSLSGRPNLVPDFVVNVPRMRSGAVSIRNVDYAGHASRIDIMEGVSRSAIGLARYGLIARPWLATRIGWLCFRAGIVNMSSIFLRARRSREYCTSIAFEVKGDWRSPYWGSAASHSATASLSLRRQVFVKGQRGSSPLPSS